MVDNQEIVISGNKEYHRMIPFRDESINFLKTFENIQ